MSPRLSPIDCGVCQYCGDGVCDPTEDCGLCPEDCGACLYCGDGLCTAGEDCFNCAGDCGTCAPTQYCGDGYCDLAVGRPGASFGGLAEAGLVHVFNGTEDGLDTSTSELWWRRAHAQVCE